MFFFGFTHNNRKGGPFFYRIRLNFKMKSVSVDWKDLDLNALNEITFKDFKKKKIGKISKYISGVKMSMN